jgi:hypothetical protein
MLYMQNHFWAGCLCYIMDGKKTKFPDKVIAGSDIVTLIADLGNQIPDKSWMLYLFELFVDKRSNIPLELNLICQFDNQNYFEAIFGGHNQYRFTKILPQVGHTYKREIIVNPKSRVIDYHLSDIQTGRHETFQLHERNFKHPSLGLHNIKFEGSRQFTGIEWWNKVGPQPYPIRYLAEISLLSFSRGDSLNSDEVKYFPYQLVKSDTDRIGKQYPISFINPRVMDGCICYNVETGSSNTGLTYPPTPWQRESGRWSFLRKILHQE